MIKFCTYGGLSKHILDSADEIKILHPTYEVLLNEYCIKYPNKTFILVWDNEPEEVTIPELKQLQKLYPETRFIIALEHIYWISTLRENNIQWFYNYPLTTFYDLNGVVGAGACMALVGPPLIFQMDTLHEYNIDIRIRPNIAYYGSEMTHKDGVTGGWIRPEDLSLYDPCTIEFYGDTQAKQETLYRIYKYDKEWGGDLNVLIMNLNINVDNRALPEDFGKNRLNCRQRCEENDSCHYCDMSIKFAQAIERKVNEIQKR